MLVDLNVPWPQNSYADKVTSQAVNNLIKTLSTLHMLGYTHIAINFTVNHSEKFPNDVKLLNPIDIKRRFGELMDRTGLKLYSRITLIIDDPSK